MISDFNMTVKKSNFEKNVAAFFQDAGMAEKYLRLTKLEEKVKLIWTTPIMQVCLNFVHQIILVKCFLWRRMNAFSPVCNFSKQYFFLPSIHFWLYPKVAFSTSSPKKSLTD